MQVLSKPTCDRCLVSQHLKNLSWGHLLNKHINAEYWIFSVVLLENDRVILLFILDLPVAFKVPLLCQQLPDYLLPIGQVNYAFFMFTLSIAFSLSAYFSQ